MSLRLGNYTCAALPEGGVFGIDGWPVREEGCGGGPNSTTATRASRARLTKPEVLNTQSKRKGGWTCPLVISNLHKLAGDALARELSQTRMPTRASAATVASSNFYTQYHHLVYPQKPLLIYTAFHSPRKKEQ